MQNNLKFTRFIQFFLVILPVFLVQCKSDKKSAEANLEDSIQIVEIDETLITEIKTAKQIFYSLPSPLETAMLLKKAGASFNPEILNPVGHASNYNTTKAMALNLGIYSTDLSYASLFDQTQYAIEYMSAARKMVDGLGISDAINNETIERLQENLNHRDVIMDIISEAFMNSSSYLKENNRSAISAIVLVGGWIEGLYLATHLVDETDINHSGLVERIVDQKLSLINMMRLLNQYKDNEDVKEIIILVEGLKNVYDDIKITTTPVHVVDDKSSVAKLRSHTEASIDIEQFRELKNQVKIIRKNFTL